MARTLGDFIKVRREELGLNQTELSRRSGVPRETINRLEQNKTNLPFADSRRRLAEALGVTHLDMLVAAGELTEEEARANGGQLTARDPDPRKERLYALIRSAAIPDPYYLGLIPMLEALQPGAPQVHEAVERSGANGQ